MTRFFHLSRNLTSWQSRVPPLVQKFQERDKQARALEEELKTARARIESFEEMARTNQTRIEPVDADSLLEGMDASNEPPRIRQLMQSQICRIRSMLRMTMRWQWKKSLKR